MATADTNLCQSTAARAEDTSESAIIRQMVELADAISTNGAETASAVRDIASCLEMLREAWPSSANPSRDDSRIGSTCDNLRSSPVDVEGNSRFEIRRLLGHGGFGVVLLAFDRRLGREVALKVPRPEMLVSRNMRQRFLREAQTAAILDHPNIVPIYDTGEIGPIWYIASRYVAGPTLAEWLRAQGSPLSSQAAAELVAILAEAVHHAHSRGVLHRDLKSANVLLEPDEPPARRPIPFTPKLSDFGLAQRQEETDHTHHDVLVGTPRYMAPEQAAGRCNEIGIQTDVYGLGAILYEVLTEKPPFAGDSDIETMRLIQDEPVPTAPLCERSIASDLQAICLKCLEKEQTKRYETARELAADLRRYLAGEPVTARPVSHAERLLRWCRRRPLQAAMSAALIIVTFAGIAGITWQWLRAERNVVIAQHEKTRAEENLRQVEHAFVDLQWMFEEGGMWSSSDDTFSVLLLGKLNRYADEIVPQYVKDGASTPVAAAFYSMTAKSQSLDDQPDAAEANYRKSIDLWCQLLREHPQNGEYQRAFGITLYGYAAHLLKAGRIAGNVLDFHQVEQMFDKLHLPPEDELRARMEYAQLMSSLGFAQARRGRDREALPALTLANQMWHELAEHSSDIECRQSEATTLVAIAVRQMRVNNDLSGALRSCQQAREIVEEALATDPSRRDSLFVLAETLRYEAYYTNRSGKPSEAVSLYQRSIDVYRSGLTDASPTSPNFEQLGALYQGLARQLLTMHGATVALEPYQQCAQIWEALLKADGLSKRNENRLGSVYCRIGEAQKQLGHPDEAIAAFRRSVELIEHLRNSADSRQASAGTLARSYSELGDLLSRNGQLVEAAECHRKATTLFKQISSDRPNDQRLRKQLQNEESRLEELEDLPSDERITAR